MKVIIVGAGRMGLRHAQGVLNVPNVNKVTLVDIYPTALDNAKLSLETNPNYSKCTFKLFEELGADIYDTGILAATANNRSAAYQRLVSLGCRNILVEKPLGQSYEEVLAFESFVQQSNRNCAVNLNMRIYPSFKKIRDDLQTLPQLSGFKTITINTGTLGIGANGIHYLDLLFYFLDADSAELVAAHIDETTIPSGRGAMFGDFGGWAVINFSKKDQQVGKALLSMSSKSTVFGSFDIVAPHGRIYLNEVEEKCIYTLRKPDSTMPINRYFADYMPSIEKKITSPFLGDLTQQWIEGLFVKKQILPTISESLKSHSLMFEWLNYSKQYQNHFPIT